MTNQKMIANLITQETIQMIVDSILCLIHSGDDHDNTTSDNEDKRAKSAEPKGPKALKDFFNPKLDKITKGNENPRSPLGTPNSDITVINNSSVRSLELKITELETKNTFYKKENDTLALEIQKIKSEREKVYLNAYLKLVTIGLPKLEIRA